MLVVTLKSLLARKLRLILSGIAVVLGVAFVSGTLVLTATLGSVFDSLFAQAHAGVAVAVRGTAAFDTLGGDADREPVPDAVVDRLRQVDGVRTVVGVANGYAQVVDKDGNAVGNGFAPTFGTNWTDALNPLKLVTGTPPAAPDDIVIDEGTAEKTGYRVGDVVPVLTHGAPQKFRISGIATFGTSNSLAGASLAAFDSSVARQLLGTDGGWSEVDIAAADGVSERALRSRVADVLPHGFEALTGDQLAAENSDAIKTGLGFFTTALLVFAGIALFVGAFIIVNTFSILVAQRSRELALMRALGASRGQVTRSVVLEAAVVGLVSSAIGLGAGIGVAVGLKSVLGTIGLDLPAGAIVVGWPAVVWAFVVGIGVTSLAAVIPARKAGRVPPVAAMRDDAVSTPARSLRRRTAVGAAALLAGVAALAAGLPQGQLPLVGLGAVLAFLGVATLSPLIVAPVTGTLALPFARLGVPGRLARENAMRNPRRTSATAAALMIGLALVSAISVLGSSAKASVGKVVADTFAADYLLSTKTFQGFSPSVATAIEGKPGIAAVAAVRFGQAKVGSDTVQVEGVEPATLDAVYKIDTFSGSFGSLSTGDVAVSKKVADAHHLHVGGALPMTFSATGSQPLRVVAIYDQNQFAGDYLLAASTYEKNFTSSLVSAVAVKIANDADPAATRKVVDKAVAAYPNIDVQDQAEFAQSQRDQVDQLVNIVTVLLVLSVLIALLGIVNTLALSIVERTREIGLLRAVGMSRRQLRSMIRVESVVIAVYGALLGLVVGGAFGWALVSVLRDQGITDFSLPVGRLVTFLVVAALAGVLAAALPGRRAAKLDVLRAIASE